MISQLPDSIIASLVDESLDAVVIIDETCIIRYVNQAMQTLSGYAPGESIGQSLNGLLPDGVAALHDRHVQHYSGSNEQSSVLGRVREFAIRHRTGEMIPIELKAVDLGLTEGVRYFGGFMEDLRPRRAMEARQNELLARLEEQALTDTLTRLPNRRAFDSEAEHALGRAQRQGGVVTIGIADIDHFKSVNDRHGHPAGDLVLCELAAVMREAARGTDVVARTGGEEFGLIFTNAAADKAQVVAERIRTAVEATTIETPGGASLRVTISIGLAELMPAMRIDEALAHADAALYEAKHGGRNQVRLYHAAGTPPATQAGQPAP